MCRVNPWQALSFPVERRQISKTELFVVQFSSQLVHTVMGEYIPEERMWLFGMSLNIFGSVMVNFGTNLMKSAHNLFEVTEAQKDCKAKEEANKTFFNSHNVWALGLTIFCVGCLINFASFAFAAQSLLAALGTIQFVSNVFFAKFVLGETLTLRIVIATGVIVGGLLLAIIFSNHASETFTSEDLQALYTPTYFLFLGCLVVLLCFFQGTYMVYTHYDNIGTPLEGNGIVRPVTYSLVSALVGTQSVLQSKCFAELVKATLSGKNQFGHYFIYVVIVNFVCGLSFWLWRMNSALKMFDGLIIIPLLQVFWTTCAILQGGVFFQEFAKFTPTQSFFFLFGVCVVFFGVYLLTPQPQQKGVELLPSESENSLVGGSKLGVSSHSSSSSVPDAFTTTSKNSLLHGLHPHPFSNAGLSYPLSHKFPSGSGPSHQYSDSGPALMQEEDISTHTLFSLTFLPVVVERLEPAHQRRSRTMSTNLGDIEVPGKFTNATS